MEIKEEWKDIQGYENLYQISSMGRVKSLGNGSSNNSKEKILKQGICKGYCLVGLSKEGKVKTYKVHRLVAQAFLPNPDNLPEVNHKSEVKTENCVDNLEYCSHTYNSNFGTRNERISKPIVQIDKSGLIVGVYNSAFQVERELGINHSNISQCCKGKYKTCGGYKWKYLDVLKKAS